MPITNISKTAGAASMECGGAVDINLAVAAAPGAATQRVAIALILDRSGSMAGTPMLPFEGGRKRVCKHHHRCQRAKRRQHV